jgi:hypothetical protein
MVKALENRRDALSLKMAHYLTGGTQELAWALALLS